MWNKNSLERPVDISLQEISETCWHEFNNSERYLLGINTSMCSHGMDINSQRKDKHSIDKILPINESKVWP